jgi:hypothetical protein
MNQAMPTVNNEINGSLSNMDPGYVGGNGGGGDNGLQLQQPVTESEVDIDAPALAPASGQQNLYFSDDFRDKDRSGGMIAADGTTDVLRNQPIDQQGQNRRIILKDATLYITVKDVENRVQSISAMADEMGGWVVSSSTSQSTAYNGEKQLYGNITVRVPAERLTEAMNRIKDGVDGVDSEYVNGQDVTQSYTDLSSQLTNLEAAETQLQLIMDSAKRVDDVLSVFSQLVSTRGQIESIKGQLTYYDEASAFSSIQVTINPIPVSPVTQQTTGWSPVRTIEDALGALIGVAQNAVDFIIFLVIAVLPPVLIVGVPVFLIARRLWRNRKARRAVIVAP